MSITREECELALEIIENLDGIECITCRANGIDDRQLDISENYSKAIEKMYELIEEHFNNPPLKFSELKPDMWVWDDEYKAWRQIHTTYHSNLHDVVEFKDGQYPTLARKYFFEENRFYRKQVEE